MRWPPWAPPLPAQPTRPNPEPLPKLSLLGLAFDWAYQTMPAHVWALPPRDQSDAVLRKVAEACRVFLRPCKGLDHMVNDPDTHLAEYLTLMALATVDIEDWLCDLHHDHPDDPFPATYYDPRERIGRPSGASL
jgi:hypothetical protein